MGAELLSNSSVWANSRLHRARLCGDVCTGVALACYLASAPLSSSVSGSVIARTATQAVVRIFCAALIVTQLA